MPHKVFTVQNTIRFNHCDPAGIVFFPRYFEMTNRALEKFFTEILGQSYLDLMKKNIITPTRKISSEFFKPCLLEEIITITLNVTTISRSTVELLFEFTGDAGDKRLTVEQLIVFADHQKMKSISLPAEFKEILQDYLV